MTFAVTDLQSRIRNVLSVARQRLLAERNAAGHWEGELSTSALSTATAVCALEIVRRERGVPDEKLSRLVQRGLEWLAKNQNPDGGWGDTTVSFSNISTTMLCWAAYGVAPGADTQFQATVRQAEGWLNQKAGGIGVDKLVPAIVGRYGKDRTFSVPILTMCALAGRLGKGADGWRHVLPLPFELAAFPAELYAALRLPVVSYALPALIAIGQARHKHLPSDNPFARLTRNAMREPTLRVLERIQPSSGGFLEATPLTSFVTMSLAGSGRVQHPVTTKAVEFLVASVRPDGSWPIDTNLATWVTTLSVNALSRKVDEFSETDRVRVGNWLIDQQYRVVHPYTNAAPGGWAWTDLPGGVPDADDTAGALLALSNLNLKDLRVRDAVELGIGWLLDLQNSDGGIPTFCRGWTNLPFDRSGADLTAHALRAWSAWRHAVSEKLQTRIDRALVRAHDYLGNSQREDGSWLPLWFGNQHEQDDENPLYGTARVLDALATSGSQSKMIQRGTSFLLSLQQDSGAWSGCPGGPPSIEETALALECLARIDSQSIVSNPGEVATAIARGAGWLADRVEDGSWERPSPIGFYFAKLWYYEKLYPLIFTVGALERVLDCLDPNGSG